MKTLVLTHRDRRTHANFLDLPPELRLRIYQYMLIPSLPLHALRHQPTCHNHDPLAASTPPPYITALRNRPKPASWRSLVPREHLAEKCRISCIQQSGQRRNLAILRVSRLVYKEAIEILWEDEKWGFTFTGLQDFVDSMKTMPLEGRSRVRKLVVREDRNMDVQRRGFGLKEWLHAEFWRFVGGCPRLKYLEVPSTMGGVLAGEVVKLGSLEVVCVSVVGWMTFVEGMDVHKVEMGVKKGFKIRCGEIARKRREQKVEEWLRIADGRRGGRRETPEWMQRVNAVLEKDRDAMVHQEGGRDWVTVTLADGLRTEVEIWGLPTHSKAERRRLFLQEARKPKELEVSRRTVPDLPKLRGENDKELALMARKSDQRAKIWYEPEEDHEALLEERRDQKKQEAKTERTKEKQKERRKMKRSEKQLAAEKKAVAKRAGRREMQ
ncbi:unnamed protein product [Zymoseptoria tritici ST99CH_1A5]|uniref:DUF7730 domain-containing protein n=1 Tax=Zymoseptoria tritici ST99CH_1A5 TaxID=1276529 RepID=A0A1Y6LJW6_ZYMTR|nr:unnamed protein product [Zymoseptoria tritici ST99CH_1A5]